MKRVGDVPGVYPGFAADLESKGVSTVQEFANIGNLEELHTRTDIPLTLLQKWQADAQAEIEASRYIRKVGFRMLVAIVIFASIMCRSEERRVGKECRSRWS